MRIIISTTTGKYLLPSKPTSERAKLADGVTTLKVTGETSSSAAGEGQPVETPFLIIYFMEPGVPACVPFMMRNNHR